MIESKIFELISKLKTYKVTDFKGDDDYTRFDDREPAPIFESTVVSSPRTDASAPKPRSFDDLFDSGPNPEREHALLLDLDVPAYLVPSSTPGHSHLYVDVRIPESKYMKLLEALGNAGVIEDGYVVASQARGGTALRLPWVKKELDEKEDAAA